MRDRASASAGVIGRRWAVPPSRRTASASHQAGEFSMVPAYAPGPVCGGLRCEVSGEWGTMEGMALPEVLVLDLQSAGYYPQLTQGILADSLFDEPVLAHFVHIDTHVDIESIHRQDRKRVV